MRMVIDLQGCQTDSRFRGIGRCSFSLTQAIVKNAEAHEIWLVLNAAFPESISYLRQAFDGLIPPQRIRVFNVPTPLAGGNPLNTWRAQAAEKIREQFIEQFQPDIVLITSLFEGTHDDAVSSVPANYGKVKVAVFFYDLIPLMNPEVYLSDPNIKNHYERKIQWLKNTNLLLAFSEYTRSEAIRVLGFNSDQLVTIWNAADSYFKQTNQSLQQSAKLCERYGITRKMVMCTLAGGFDPHKNIVGLLTAYSLLPVELRQEYQLVLVSKISDDVRSKLDLQSKQLGLTENDLVLTGYVEDEDLVSLYNEATLFVYPSMYEGFGLPALEAMKCGLPVIGSNTTSIPEVIGLEDALFDPTSPHSIMEKMAYTMRNSSFRKQLSVHGLNQAKKFSWDESAKRALRAIETLVPEKAVDVSEKLLSNQTLVQAIADIRHAGTPSDNDLVQVAYCVANNQVRTTKKQLLLDISVLIQHDAKSGIPRVSRSILLELLLHPPQNIDVRPIYFDSAYFRYANAFATSVFTDYTYASVNDDIVEFCPEDSYLSIDLNAHFTDAIYNLFLSLKNHGIHFYFMIHDILFVERHDWNTKEINAVFNVWLHSITEVATGLICPTQTVVNEVQSWLINNSPQNTTKLWIRSSHHGADIKNSLPSAGMPDNATFTLKHLRSKNSFLMVGTVEPRKAHTQTLAAFELLWQQGIDINLVIVGKQGWMVDDLAKKIRKHTELNQRLFWLEGISDEFLEYVYQHCTCLIAPSEGEGFGLPLIEAAQHKLPIIARDIPVFREVAINYAYYFSGLSPLDLANAVKKWLIMHKKGMAPQSIDMPYLTWQESAQQLIECIGLSTTNQHATKKQA